MTRLLPLLLTLALGCASRSQVDPTPSWTTSTGRDKAKLELAEALLSSGKPEAALQLLSQMESSRNPSISVLQGKAMAAMGLTDDAEAVLAKAAKRPAAAADANNALGILYLDQTKTDEAIARFQAAAKSDPKDADVHNNLGFALMAAGRHSEAVLVLRKALVLDSSQARTRNNLGFALAADGQDKAAWRVLRAGSALADAHYNLALAQEMRGDLEKARKSYGAALEDNPHHDSAKAGLARLDAGKSPTVSSPPQE